MSSIHTAVIACASLFVAMVVLDRIGENLRRRSDQADNTSVSSSAVFGLLGLLLAFTYYGAFGRLEGRRTMAIDELNAIGTAYLRLELLPSDAQPEIRSRYRQYADARIAWYTATSDQGMADAMATAGRLQGDIWSRVISSTAGQPSNEARLLLLPALNDVFDRTTVARAASMWHHPPLVVVSLFVVSLVAALLAGYSVSGDRVRHRVETIAFAAVVAFSVYVIMDMDYPRYGVVRLDEVGVLLQDTLAAMK